MGWKAAAETCCLAHIGQGEAIETLVGDQSCRRIKNSLLRFFASFFLSASTHSWIAVRTSWGKVYSTL